MMAYTPQADNTTFAWMAFDFPHAIYFIAFELDNGPGSTPDEFKARTVKAYRFSQAPAASKWTQENAFTENENSYLYDCVAIVTYDGKNIPNYRNSLGIEYELIYFDPPVKPDGKSVAP
jgi:hypothetical protein